MHDPGCDRADPLIRAPSASAGLGIGLTTMDDNPLACARDERGWNAWTASSFHVCGVPWGRAKRKPRRVAAARGEVIEHQAAFLRQRPGAPGQRSVHLARSVYPIRSDPAGRIRSDRAPTKAWSMDRPLGRAAQLPRPTHVITLPPS